MLSRHAIWVTDYRFLNDRTEVQHSLKLAKALIADRMKDRPDKHSSALYVSILEKLDDPVELSVCVFSASAQADSLSQWRGYARNGCGFTIGFEVSPLIERAESKDAEFAFAKIEYDEDRQRQGLSRALDQIESACKTARSKGEAPDIVTDEGAATFDTIAWNRGVINKHRSFESESEWRLSSFALNDGADLKVRARGNALVPYMEMEASSLCNAARLPIKRIGIGPGFAQQEQSSAVLALCRQYGYDPEIYLADAPYRAS